MLEKYTTLLIDIDDTLLDFQFAQHYAIQQLFHYYKLPVTTDNITSYKRMNQSMWEDFEKGTLTKQQLLDTRFSNFFKQFHIKVDGKAADERYRHFLTQGNQVIEGVIPFLNRVSPTHRLAIISNGVYQTQMNRLKNNDLLKFFDAIFISDQIGYQKPSIHFFNAVIEQMQISTKETLIIGDSLTADIQGGINAKIDTCFINTQQITPTIQPTYMVHTIKDLLT